MCVNDYDQLRCVIAVLYRPTEVKRTLESLRRGGGVDATHLYTPVEALTHASGSRYFSLCAMLQNILFYFLFMLLSFSRFL